MDIFFRIKSKKCQFALSFLSAIIYQAGFEIIMSSCSFTVYFLSYIHYEQTWVDMNYGNLMRPVVLLFLAFFAPLSGTMEHFCGPRISIIVSAIVVEIGFASLFFQRNLWIFYLLTLLLGIGSGLSTNVLIKNSCSFYPRKKGLINAIISSLGSLFGAAYALLGEKVINPQRELVIDNIKAPYYREEIAEKSRIFFLFAMFIIPTSTIFSAFFLYRYDPKYDANADIQQKFLGKGDRPTPKGSSLRPGANNGVKKVIKSFRFWRNILIVGAMPFMIWFESATSRPFSVMIGVKGEIIGILSGTMSILGCITNPIWAFCVDKFGFRPIMIIISILTISMSVFFYIFMDNPFYYVIGLYVSSTLRGGVICSLIPHMMEVFGMRYFLTLGGLGRLFTQLFSFGAAGVSIVISIFRKGKDELLLPYKIVSLVAAGFAAFGLILTFFENDEKFNYEDDDENEKIEKINDDDEEQVGDRKVLGGEIGEEEE
jgi:MFS family permease